VGRERGGDEDRFYDLGGFYEFGWNEIPRSVWSTSTELRERGENAIWDRAGIGYQNTNGGLR
jgi:hypothetical protein